MLKKLLGTVHSNTMVQAFLVDCQVTNISVTMEQNNSPFTVKDGRKLGI